MIVNKLAHTPVIDRGTGIIGWSHTSRLWYVSRTCGLYSHVCLFVMVRMVQMADFIEGLHTLKANGEYDRITAMHGDPKTFNDFHGNDYFLPWHRWYASPRKNVSGVLVKATSIL